MASAFALREPRRSPTHLVKRADFTKQTARTGAVPLIQGFGSALNLTVHFHTLFLDGVYVDRRRRISLTVSLDQGSDEQ
jgi:hypothetical protein